MAESRREADINNDSLLSTCCKHGPVKTLYFQVSAIILLYLHCCDFVHVDINIEQRVYHVSANFLDDYSKKMKNSECSSITVKSL